MCPSISTPNCSKHTAKSYGNVTKMYVSLSFVGDTLKKACEHNHDNDVLIWCELQMLYRNIILVDHSTKILSRDVAAHYIASSCENSLFLSELLSNSMNTAVCQHLSRFLSS